MKIRRKMSIILGMMLSFIIVFASIPALRVKANDSIIDKTRKGSITIHKYLMKEMPVDGKEATGEVLADTDIPSGAIPLGGVTFDIYKVADGTKDTTVPEGAKPIIKVTTADGSNGTKGVAVASDLELGTYLVVEEDNSQVTQKCANFIVNVPMTDKDGSKWIYDVHVYPKNATNETPVIHKSVTKEGNQHDSADINKDVTWIIEPSIPKTIADYKKYEITDKIDSRLTYSGNLSVSVKDNESINLLKTTDYEVTEPSEKDNVLKVVFTTSGLKKLSAVPGGSVKITFTTKINSTAVMGAEIPNQATLSYTNEFNEAGETQSDKPEVHTGGVELLKDDADTKAVLKGAEFKIYRSEKDAIDGTNAIKNPENEKEDWVAVSGEDGIAKFYGLKYGTIGQAVNEGATDYWIVEVKAPKDEKGKAYTLLSKPLKVTINAKSHTEKIEVENSKFFLPITGGMGVVVFTASGILLMIAAVFLFIRSNRKQNVR
ncbi:SpaH/EbpB family LPXTG-anchored major pilin [Inconstantimicrobium porci]|nr:SpaH/EbpB family LPXTG-anchored major pilin [Inconstantimicrobium porci]